MQFEFLSDPGRYYLFHFILLSGFNSIIDMKNYLKVRNESLLPVLSSLLIEMEHAGIISIEGDDVKQCITEIDFDDKFFRDIDLFGDLARTTILGAYNSHQGFQYGFPQKTAGFRYVTLPYSRRTMSRLNAILKKFETELFTLISESEKSERPEFLYLSVSRSLMRPEDFL